MPNIRDDFAQSVVVDTKAMTWSPSPVPEIERRMLDRIGDEVARATSLVRYAPNSKFPSHAHAMGEEFLVLDGVFQDEHGAYPAGTYVRNPWGTSHAPFTKEGCTIFVKLRQMDQDDQLQFALDTNSAKWEPTEVTGITKVELHSFREEHVWLEQWAPGTEGPSTDEPPHLEEIFVLEGEFEDGARTYGPGYWLRRPSEALSKMRSQAGGRLFIKHMLLPV